MLLVPGANSSSDTFLLPFGGLAAHLACEHGWDVWLFDWRASPKVVVPLTHRPVPLGGTAASERLRYSLDVAIAEDLSAALALVRGQIGSRPLSVLGHCVGGAAVATATARGVFSGFGVDRVVLSTLGLFYEVPWRTWIKAEDLLLERLVMPDDQPGCRVIDPKRPDLWPRGFRHAYERWPQEWLPGGSSPSDDFLKRLSFMVGQPYTRARLEPAIDGAPVESVFGPLHLGLYTHLGQMVRRGFSSRFVADPAARNTAETTDLNPAPFRDVHVTLVAAADNGVWHRDALDRMHDWLRRFPYVRSDKHVVPGCNIQELFWGAKTRATTYPMFAEGLG